MHFNLRKTPWALARDSRVETVPGIIKKQTFQVSFSLVCFLPDRFSKVLMFGDGCSNFGFCYSKAGSAMLNGTDLSLVF